jgi:hypothetical protein
LSPTLTLTPEIGAEVAVDDDGDVAVDDEA